MTDFNTLLTEVLSDEDLHASEIPAIELYLDQIISLLDTKYGPAKRKVDDKLLTNTMIHNYRKEGLLKPVKGKKYTKEHFLQMLIILAMKNSLSIQEIKAVFSRLYQDPAFNCDGLCRGYEYALTLKEKESERLIRYFSELVVSENADSDQSKRNTPEEMFPVLLYSTFLSGYLQRIAGRIVDECFTPDPVRPGTP